MVFDFIEGWFLQGLCIVILNGLFYYYFYTNTDFPSAIIVSYLTLGEWSLGIVVQEDLSQRYKSSNTSGRQ